NAVPPPKKPGVAPIQFAAAETSNTAPTRPRPTDIVRVPIRGLRDEALSITASMLPARRLQGDEAFSARSAQATHTSAMVMPPPPPESNDNTETWRLSAVVPTAPTHQVRSA